MNFLGATLLLIGLDAYITNARLKEFGPQVELNPVIRWAALKGDRKLALAVFALTNLGLLALGVAVPTFMHVLFGAKLTLASLQLRSLGF